MGVTYNRLISDYDGDLTKECGLTVNEVDSNFYFLRGSDLEHVNINEDKTIITFNFVNGKKIDVPLSQTFSEINERIDEIIDEIVLLGNNDNNISNQIINVYEQLGFDENGKFKPSSENPEECSIYIKESKNVNDALFILDNTIAGVDGKYGEDIVLINDSLMKIDDDLQVKNEEIQNNANNISFLKSNIEDLDEQDKVLQKHIDDEITLRDSNDIRIEKEYKASDEILRNEIKVERNERVNNITDINNTISEIKNGNTIINDNISDLYIKVGNINDKLNVNDGINEEQNKRINDSSNSINQINGILKNLEEIVKGYQSSIQILNDRCNVLESENRNLRSKIEEITENGGLIDQCRMDAVKDAKREIISSDVFKSEGTEIAVNVESGTVKIGFAESLFLGV